MAQCFFEEDKDFDGDKFCQEKQQEIADCLIDLKNKLKSAEQDPQKIEKVTSDGKTALLNLYDGAERKELEDRLQRAAGDDDQDFWNKHGKTMAVTLGGGVVCSTINGILLAIKQHSMEKTQATKIDLRKAGLDLLKAGDKDAAIGKFKEGGLVVKDSGRTCQELCDKLEKSDHLQCSKLTQQQHQSADVWDKLAVVGASVQMMVVTYQLYQAHQERANVIKQITSKDAESWRGRLQKQQDALLRVKAEWERFFEEEVKCLGRVADGGGAYMDADMGGIVLRFSEITHNVTEIVIETMDLASEVKEKHAEVWAAVYSGLAGMGASATSSAVTLTQAVLRPNWATSTVAILGVACIVIGGMQVKVSYETQCMLKAFDAEVSQTLTESRAFLSETGKMRELAKQKLEEYSEVASRAKSKMQEQLDAEKAEKEAMRKELEELRKLRGLKEQVQGVLNSA